jgi:oligopeptide transport system ATP-binding protein
LIPDQCVENLTMIKGNEHPIMEIRSLEKYFPVTAGLILDRVVGCIKALDGVDLSLGYQDIVGLVGESGSGKSTLAKVILLLERATRGEILFEGKEVSHFNGNELKDYRRKVQAVFQDPFSSLSPRMKVKNIIAEPLRVVGNLTRKELEDKIAEALRVVGLLPTLMNVFPHELSGGQRQRVAIARAIATEANFIVLDEPTSALDVSVRLQIVDLLIRLQRKLGLTYLIIGHDLGMMAYLSVHIAVMYLGKIVEFAETKELLQNTVHPYTQALISAALPTHPRERRERIMLPGEIANPLNVPPGCRFHPRCFQKKGICSQEVPPLKGVGKTHWVACHL